MPIYQLLSLKKPFFSFALLFFLSTSAFAQFTTDGFLRNYNAVLTTSDNEYLVGRNRFLLNVEHPISIGKIFISNEILNTYTNSVNDYLYDFVEGYVDLYFENFDLRIGKQIVSQGKTDGAFISDIISPVDLSEFLTIEVEDIRIGIPAAKYTRYFGADYLEILATPVFQSNTFALPGTRWFPFSQFEQNVNVSYTDSTAETTKPLFQGLIKYSFREKINWDLDLFAMFWTEGSPAFSKELIFTGTPPIQQPSLLLTRKFYRSPIIGYYGNYIINDRLLIKSESAFHFEKQFDYLPQAIQEVDLNNLTLQQQTLVAQAFASNQDGFLTSKPWFSGMVGIQSELDNWTISTQFINEYIFNYQTDILQEQYFYYSTLMLQKSILREKITLYAFGRYNYAGKDFWVHPRTTYEVAEAVEATVGFHLFHGEEQERYYGHFSFDDYQPNSFMYLKLAAYF